MSEGRRPEARSEQSRRWGLIYASIAVMTLVVYIALWFFSQAFLR